jgi:molybdenum cofactor cytidylyltransferase
VRAQSATIGAVLLAAGGSERLGRPKQLLRHRGSTLVRRAATAALEAGCSPVVVVTGARHEAIRAELELAAVEIVHNRDWSRGIAGSIRVGVKRVAAASPAVAAVVLLASDQPALDRGVIERLVAAFDGKPGRRVACAYAGTVGVPALFERELFDALTRLDGDRGAQPLLLAEPGLLARVPWPEGEHDVDLPGDLPRES